MEVTASVHPRRLADVVARMSTALKTSMEIDGGSAHKATPDNAVKAGDAHDATTSIVTGDLLTPSDRAFADSLFASDETLGGPSAQAVSDNARQAIPMEHDAPDATIPIDTKGESVKGTDGVELPVSLKSSGNVSNDLRAALFPHLSKASEGEDEDDDEDEDAEDEDVDDMDVDEDEGDEGKK